MLVNNKEPKFSTQLKQGDFFRRKVKGHYWDSGNEGIKTALDIIDDELEIFEEKSGCQKVR